MFIKSSLVLFLILFISTFSLGQEEPAMGEEEIVSGLSVEEMVFCTTVENREPVGADTAFADTIGQVYCFTQISGAEDTTTISHVWYLNGEEKASVDLSVRGKTWRTWSSKRIPKEWDGSWRVDVESETGVVLKSKEFVVR